jgi:pimeloyl-ACP methyl ester carboxylesterase
MNKEILYQNKKIFYRAIGDGKPVMLVHGFGEDGNVWDKQVEFLKENYYLVVPDLPGSGRSAMISDMSMEGLAEVLHAIIHEEMPPLTPPKEGLAYSQNQLNNDSLREINTELLKSSKTPPLGVGGPWTVIGHSMGGYVTLALAETYWNHVNTFGLFHSTSFADTEEKKETRKKGIDFIKKHGAFEFLKSSSPNLFSPNSKSQIPNSIEKFIDSLANFSADALVSYYNAMMKRPDRTAVLKNTEKPVLFIAGEHDNAVPLNDVLKQCYLPEKSYFHLLKNSGHMGMMEESEKTNRILQDFLSNNEN